MTAKLEDILDIDGWSRSVREALARACQSAAKGGSAEAELLSRELGVANLLWRYVLLASTLLLIARFMPGWDDAPALRLLDGTIALAFTVGGALWWVAHRRRRMPAWLQYSVTFSLTVGVAVASWAAGGREGVALASAFAFAAIVAKSYFPRGWFLAQRGLAGVAYATVVYVSAGSVAQFLLIVSMTGMAGLIAGRYHARLRSLARRLQQSEQWRAAMMSSLAHDLRSPLGAAASSIDLLAERHADLSRHQIDQLVAGARRQTDRALRLTTDLLDQERIRGGVLELDLVAVDVRELAVSTAGWFSDAQVDVEVPDGLTVVADPDRLEQILFNLVSNAVKHGRPPIQIGADRPDGGYRIWVRDHGGGVTDEVRATLFERFGRTSRRKGSVGLGLWIVNQLTRAHEGVVRYKDADPGARFVVELPEQRSRNAGSAAASAGAPA